jgi:sec-independent protein translocase protein TatA
MYNHSVIAGVLGGLGTTELILIALVVLLLFGGRKIPELMRGIGKGIKSFKEGVKGIEDDMNDAGKKDTDAGQDKKPQN